MCQYVISASADGNHFVRKAEGCGLCKLEMHVELEHILAGTSAANFVRIRQDRESPNFVHFFHEERQSMQVDAYVEVVSLLLSVS